MAKGMWVKFDAAKKDFPGAHRSVDGKVVGIFTPAGIDPLSGDEVPAKINVVTKDLGENLVEIVDNHPRNMTVDPATTPHVSCDVPADCPAERVKHLVV